MRRAALIAAAALLLGAAGAWLLLRGGAGTLGESAALIAQGGEEQLRDPLRPIRGGARVLLVALDGVGDDALRTALGAGRLPALAALLGERVDEDRWRSGYAASDVLAILPSTTMAAWATAYTGHPPARTGVAGNEWFARETRTYWAPGPVSVTGHAHTLSIYTDGLLGQAIAVPTLFERAGLRSAVTLAPVFRGADLLAVAGLEDLAELLGGMAEGLTGDEPVERELYAEVDRAGVEKTLELMEAHGAADLQVVYFPGVDLYTHAADAPLAAQQRYLAEVVDPALEQLLDAYRAAGILDSTWVVVTADHGHTPVLRDDRHALGFEGEDEPPEVLRRAGFRVRPGTLDSDDESFQATVAYQGAFGYLYLADRSTCPGEEDRCDWSRPPRREEDLLPVARAFRAASDHGAGVPELRGTLDLVLIRTTGDDGGATLEVVEEDVVRPLADWLAANPRPELLRLEERLAGLVDGPLGHHAGDVLLLTRTGEERPLEERFYFSGPYHSWHGSPYAQDSRIPLLVARRGVSGADIGARVRAVLGSDPGQEDLTPLVLELLEVVEGAPRAARTPAPTPR
ncbi:MAG TPA: alkaline phosphatase family protein [Longimicrobiales bacterium]|nr:alkaline phosphatase family protein [Longimicrobiales bacterium]